MDGEIPDMAHPRKTVSENNLLTRLIFPEFFGVPHQIDATFRMDAEYTIGMTEVRSIRKRLYDSTCRGRALE
ncbi:MAG: hypothetical protein CMN76_08370 [Spirochaetaceae bacterium]|nr:hypothetical protein [Spirochaetaceae bacterium]